MKQNAIRGYSLFADLANPEKAPKLFKGAFEKIAKGTFKSTVTAKFTQDQFEEALKTYAAEMSKGKVLLQNPNFGE